MKRSKLKEILKKRTPESRRYYRLYRDLALWEDFLRIVAENHTKNTVQPRTLHGMMYVNNMVSVKKRFMSSATYCVAYVRTSDISVS